MQMEQTVQYYLRGFDPHVLFMGGLHGDEYEVIAPLQKCLVRYSSQIPDYIYIPQASPSAVKRRTRVNKYGRDLNRCFVERTPDEEARSVMNIVRAHTFRLAFVFHEDPDQDTFYVYDSKVLNREALDILIGHIIEVGVGLYSGVDDPSDPTLGHILKDGYVTVPPDRSKLPNGDFWDWSQVNGYVKRLLFPEIPGKASMEVKERLVDIVFRDLVVPLVGA